MIYGCWYFWENIDTTYYKRRKQHLFKVIWLHVYHGAFESDSHFMLIQLTCHPIPISVSSWCSHTEFAPDRSDSASSAPGQQMLGTLFIKITSPSPSPGIALKPATSTSASQRLFQQIQLSPYVITHCGVEWRAASVTLVLAFRTLADHAAGPYSHTLSQRQVTSVCS